MHIFVTMVNKWVTAPEDILDQNYHTNMLLKMGVSLTIFSIMINDIFANIPTDIGRPLFADDGALWKRGRNVDHIVKKMQKAINQVEDWGTKWGFKFSVEKTKNMFVTGRKFRDCM